MCFQTRDRRDGHTRFQVDGKFASAPDSRGLSRLSDSADPAHRTAKETSETKLKAVTVDSGYDHHIAPAPLASLLTLCTVK